MGAVDSKPQKGGQYPITPQMIECHAKALAVVQEVYNIPDEMIQDHYYYYLKDQYDSKYYKWDCRYKMENEKDVWEETKAKSFWVS